jgi:hypothetical protein
LILEASKPGRKSTRIPEVWSILKEVDATEESFAIHIVGSTLELSILKEDPFGARFATRMLAPVPSSVIEIAPPEEPRWRSQISYPLPSESIEITHWVESDVFVRATNVPELSEVIWNTGEDESPAEE